MEIGWQMNWKRIMNSKFNDLWTGFVYMSKWGVYKYMNNKFRHND